MIWLEDNPLDSLDPLLGKASPTGRVFFDPDGELLVGGLVAINFILPYIGNFIIPIDFNIFFFKGVALAHQPDLMSLWFHPSMGNPPMAKPGFVCVIEVRGGSSGVTLDGT